MRLYIPRKKTYDYRCSRGHIEEQRTTWPVLQSFTDPDVDLALYSGYNTISLGRYNPKGTIYDYVYIELY